MLDIGSYYNFELAPYRRVTRLESLSTSQVHNPDMRDVRHFGKPDEWSEVRNSMIGFLAQNVGGADYVGQGRRYIAYQIAGVLAKFLFKKKDMDLLVDGKKVRQTNSRDTIFTAHQQEHALVREHFSDMVPDTLFVVSPFPVDRLNAKDDAQKLTPERSHFMIQECIFNAVSIYAATLGPRAELATFRTSLEGFLSAYYRMRSSVGFIPELPSLRGENVLVGDDGTFWVVDTNNLIKTHNNDGSVASTYEKAMKYQPSDKSDNMTRQLEVIIRSLETGHIPGNPQG